MRITPRMLKTNWMVFLAVFLCVPSLGTSQVTHGDPSGEPGTISDEGVFERDLDSAAQPSALVSLRIFRLKDKALAIQPAGSGGERGPAIADVGDQLILVDPEGRSVTVGIEDRGYFIPRDRCRIGVDGWAYVLPVPADEVLETDGRPRLLSTAYIGLLSGPKPKPMTPLDPSTASKALPFLQEDVSGLADRLLEMATQSESIDREEMEAFVPRMLGESLEDRLANLSHGAAGTSFTGPEGVLHLLTIPGLDDPWDLTLGTWLTYLFDDEANLVARATGAHFPRAVVYDTGLGHEVAVTTTGVISPGPNGWMFPPADDPQRCT